MYFTVLLIGVTVTHAWLTIQPRSESFRVLAEVNGSSTVQTLRATSDDPDATYSWSIAHQDFDVVQPEYHASFFGVGSGYEFTCSASSGTYGGDEITLTIDADYGTYQSASNVNGIFSYADFRTSFTDLETDSGGNYIYNNEAITAWTVCDKSVDLQAVWELYDSSDTLLATASNALPGPLELGEIFDSNVQQAFATNGAEVSTDCPAEVTSAIEQNGAVQRMKMCWRAWSIGTFDFGLGSYFYEEQCEEIVFSTLATNTSDVALIYDVASLVVGETVRLELSLNEITLSDVDFTIDWEIGRDVQQLFDNVAYFDHRWTEDCIQVVSYTINIPSLNFAKSNFEAVFIRAEEQASYFNLVMDSNYELGEEITFVPVSSIDQSQNSVEAISTYGYAINLAIRSSGETISTKQVEYFTPTSHVLPVLDSTGGYVVDSEMVIVSDGAELSFAKTSNNFNIIDLWGEMANTLPTEPIVPGERVDVEVIHNFYSFDASHLEVSWDFGDGQRDQGDGNLATTNVIYPRGGRYNITCTIKSKFKEINLSGSRSVTVLHPLTNPLISVPEFAVGQDEFGSNARATFYVGVDEGHPFTVNIDFGDQTSQLYEVTATRSILFDHTYNQLGVFTVKISLENQVGVHNEELSVRVIRPLPDLDIDIGTFQSVSTEDELTVKAAWSDEEDKLDPLLYGAVQLELKVSHDETNLSISFENETQLPMNGRPIGEYCFSIEAKNGASCSQCQRKSPLKCVIPIEPIDDFAITASRTTLAPGGQVQFTNQASSGTEISWQYRVQESEWSQAGIITEHTFPNAGQFKVLIRAFNNVSSVENSVDIVVINAPVINELNISPDGDIYKETSRQFNVILRADSPPVEFYTWKIRCQTNRELKLEQNTTAGTFEYNFGNYGVYLLEVVGWNDNGPSEPFRLTSEVFEPIENLTLDVVNGQVLPKGEEVIVNVNMDYGSNVTIRVYPDLINFPGDFFPIFNRSIILQYDRDGTYEIRVVASNQISSDQVSVELKVITRIEDIGCVFTDQFGTVSQFPAFVQLGTRGRLSAIISEGTEYSVTWTHQNEELQGIDYPQSLTFDDTKDFQFDLAVANQLGRVDADCVLSVRLPLTEYPRLEFISKVAYFDEELKEISQRCRAQTQCSPVFNSQSLMIIRIPRGHPGITIIRVSIDDAEDVLTEFVYGNNRQKTVSVALDDTVGRRNVSVSIENGVSVLSRQLTIYTMPTVNSISIQTLSDTCIRDISSPAAEVLQACLLQVGLSDQLVVTETEIMGHFYDVDWYLDGEHDEEQSGNFFDSTFSFVGERAYTTSNVTAVVTERLTSRSFTSEIDILSIPPLEWNLVVDVEEFLYDDNENRWKDGVNIFRFDCLHFFLDIPNYDDQMELSANFTIEYTQSEFSQTVAYPFQQEFPVYRPQDTFQHKFIEVEEYRVNAIVQNAARRYTSIDNFITSATTVKVTINECQPPILSIVHDRTIERGIKFYRARATLIEINVKVPQKCLAEDYNRNNRKKWHLFEVLDDAVLPFCRGSGNGSSADKYSLFTANCQINDDFDEYLPMLKEIDVDQWDRGISSLNIPKLNLELAQHCFCFYSEFTPKNDCSDKISSWIADTFEVTPSSLVAYISGATRKKEHLNNLSCSDSRSVNIDASKSIDPDIGSKGWPREDEITVDRLENLEVEGLDELEQNWCNSSKLLGYEWNCQVYRNNELDFASTQACREQIGQAESNYSDETACSKPFDQSMRLCCYKAILQLNRNHRLYSRSELDFHFTVTVNNPEANKTAVNETQVITFGQNVPNIEIECNSCISNLHKRASQNSMVHISSYFNNLPKCNLTRIRYEWSIIESSTGELYNSAQLKSCDEEETRDACLFNFGPDDTTTGRNSKNLIIRQGVLKNEMYYFFNLTVFTSDERSVTQNFPGISQIRLLPDKLPQGGQCQIRSVGDANNITAVDGEIMFNCSGWSAGDNRDAPMLYSLGFTPFDSGVCSDIAGSCSTTECNAFDQTILYEGSQNQYTSLLPVGCNQVCVRVKTKTGSSVTGACAMFNVQLPNWSNEQNAFKAWLRLRTRHLSRLVRSNEDLATITSYASSLLSVLNSEKVASSSKLNAETRLDVMNILNENTEAMIPTSLLESSQMASTFFMLIENPEEFLALSKDEMDSSFFVNATELINKTVAPLYSASTDQYHRFNSTLTTTVDNLFSVCGYLVEILLDFGFQIGTNDPFINELLESLTAPIDELSFKVGEWSVEGERPTSRANIGGSKLSIRQSRLNQASYGSDCPRDECHSLFELNDVRVDIGGLNHNDLFGDLPPSIEILNTLLVFDLFGQNNLFDTPLLSFQFRKFIGSQSNITVSDLTSPINLEFPRFNAKNAVNASSVVIAPQNGTILSLNSTGPRVYIGLQIATKEISAYDRSPDRGVVVIVDGTTQFTFNEINCTNEHCVFDQNRLFQNVSTIQIHNRCQFAFITVTVNVFDVSCKYYEPNENEWMTDGLEPGQQTQQNRTVCLTSHLTTFGALTIPQPNTLRQQDLDLRPTNNIAAICLIVVVIVSYIILMIMFRFLDNHDLKFLSSIPLCGQDGPFSYEITIKTGMGWTAGTTANVGIRLYGNEEKSGSRHLSHDSKPFSRGKIDMFQIATVDSLGEITRIKIWHDNTGLDPAWFVSRIIVRDLQTKKRFYFLVDDWLHISPYDLRSSVEKEVHAASESDMVLFSEVFKAQKEYANADSHLWTSILTRPTRSRFTRVMRLTVAWTCLSMFMLLTMVWYQVDETIPSSQIYSFWFDASDIVTGVIASILVFPLAIILSFLFKQSRSLNSYVWPSRPPTGIVVPMEVEIPIHSNPAFESDEKIKSAEWTGGSGSSGFWTLSGTASSRGLNQLRRGSKLANSLDTKSFTTASSSESSKDDFGESNLCVIKEENTPKLAKSTRSKDSGLSIKTTKIVDEVELNEIPITTMDELGESSSIDNFNLDNFGTPLTSDQTTNECLLPHYTIKVTFGLSWLIILVSCIFVYVYSAMFGPEKTARWMLSFTFCLFMSFVILEPLKILVLSLVNSLRRIKRDPCELDNIVEYPRVEKSTSSMSTNHSKTCKVSPPHGFALEKAKETARKMLRWNKLKKSGFCFIIIFVTLVIGLCDEHLDDDNQFNKQVQSLTNIDIDVVRSRNNFYAWADSQCAHINDEHMHHVGDLYIFKNQPNVSYPDCHDGFFPSLASFGSGCGERDVIPMGSQPGCYDKIEQLQRENWFSTETIRVVGFLTLYAPHVNRLGSAEVTFSRLADGSNSFVTYHKLYTAFFHNWETAFKFSAVIYIIIFRKFIFIVYFSSDFSWSVNMVNDFIKLVQRCRVKKEDEDEKDESLSFCTRLTFIGRYIFPG